jgi:hypothetical protein
MAPLSFSQLEGVWIQAGGDPATAPLMAAIALAESSGDPTATNPTDNNGRQTSWGLWQISNGDHSEPSPNWADPLENAKLALGKIHSQGLGAWGTYTSGAYKRYLQGSVPPTTPPGGGGGQGGQSPTGGGAGITQANLTSALGNWLGPLIGAFSGDPSSAGLTTSAVLGTTLGPISNTFNDFSRALNTAMTGVVWIVNPRNWVRIIAGSTGAVAVVAGAVLVARSA